MDIKFCKFCNKKKTYIFYFTPSFLQNTHIKLSILHIYSIKYSYSHFSLEPSHRPITTQATINDQSIPTIINPPSLTHHQPTQPPSLTHHHQVSASVTIIKHHHQPPSSTHHHQAPSPQNLLIKQKIPKLIK